MPRSPIIVNKFISFLAIAAVTSMAIDGVNAQPTPTPTLTPTVPTITPKPSLPSTTPPPSQPPTEKSIEDRVDVNLLTKTLQLFWQTDRCQFDSEIVLDGKVATDSVRMTVRTNAISQIGNKFRADVTLQNTQSSPLEKYTIVSNGKKVWIYQPDKKRYTQMSWNQFNQTQSFVLGFSSVIFNQLSEAERKQLIVGKDLPLMLALMLGSSEAKDFSGKMTNDENKEFGGKRMYAYTFDGSKNSQVGLKMIATVEPTTGSLKQMKISGSDRGTDFMMTENIRSRTENVAITAKTFNFIPPKGVKKVKSIPINMFGGK